MVQITVRQVKPIYIFRVLCVVAAIVLFVVQLVLQVQPLEYGEKRNVTPIILASILMFIFFLTLMKR